VNSNSKYRLTGGLAKISSLRLAAGTWYSRCLDEYGHGEGHGGEETPLRWTHAFLGRWCLPPRHLVPGFGYSFEFPILEAHNTSKYGANKICKNSNSKKLLGANKISSASRAAGTWYLRCLDEYGHGEGHGARRQPNAGRTLFWVGGACHPGTWYLGLIIPLSSQS
jgi:hypothetical protein